MSSKRASGGHEVILVNYNKYTGVDDEEQKKKVLGDSSVFFLRNRVKGVHSFVNFFKGGLLKKKIEKT